MSAIYKIIDDLSDTGDGSFAGYTLVIDGKPEETVEQQDIQEVTNTPE